MGQTVLVVGVSRYLGGMLARRLAQNPQVDRVVGVDVVVPTVELGNVEFVRADIRNPVIGKVLQRCEADTVIHMNVIATPLTAGGRAAMKEINVIGSMQLLAACAKSKHLRTLVVRSTAGVYGASPKDPAMFSENVDALQLPRSGWAKDALEVEAYVRSFSRRRSDIAVSVLRFANVLGPHIATPFTDYLELPVWPTVMGFDPRLQWVHDEDAVAALECVATQSAHGTFNVAGEGVMTLGQASALAGRPQVPMPAALVRAGAKSLRKGRILDFSPEQLALITYGRVLDTTRIHDSVGFTPKYSTTETFQHFCAHRLAPQQYHHLIDQMRAAATTTLKRNHA